MYRKRLLFIIYFIVFLTIKCISSPFKITGVVQNGLDGNRIKGVKIVLKGTNISTTTDNRGNFILQVPYSAHSRISIKKIKSAEFLIKDAQEPDMILVASNDGYQQLEYRISKRINNLVLGILPEPGKSGTTDYTGDSIPFTSRLEEDVKWEEIIDGVRLFYENRVESIRQERELYWNRDFSSPHAYNASVEPNRRNLRKILGAIDPRERVSMKRLDTIGGTGQYTVYGVCWTVLEEITPRPALQDWPKLDTPTKITGEGILVQPKDPPKGYIVAIPDADQDPECLIGLKPGIEKESQFVRRLAENGYTVIVPVIVDRSDRWSRTTNRPSRSWIYSQAHEMGRTVAGYEIQKMEALVDWCTEQGGGQARIGMAGYGEGGLLAFYTAALDTRIETTLVSGYFAPREKVWQEPIYRNVWGLLKEFGDAEIASLIAPRSLVIEYRKVPGYDGSKNNGNPVEPPGELWTHSFKEIESEFNRISLLTGHNGKAELIKHGSGEIIPFGSEKAVNRLMAFLGNLHPLALSEELPRCTRTTYDYTARMGRMVEQMVGHTQLLLRDSEYVRKEFVKAHASREQLRDYFKEELVGWLDDDFLPLNVKTKLLERQPGYTSYHVLMDVFTNVKLWGVLTIPKGIKDGEKRPLVVLQHGRGGNPLTALGEGSGYNEVGRKLADRGFVVFTPFGNWTGETRFRWIDRIANPTKNTLWSNVVRQHQQLHRWFTTLPFVDPSRIGFYGKSIGGQAACLVVSALPEYSMSISCAYFNESARKETSVYFPTSFVYHVDSEMPMWNRGHTLEYAEMGNSLIFPRPFMVEHGKQDGIAPPGWVEYEYDKVHTYYERQRKKDLTEIDLHEGGHIINGVKSFPFLHKHLRWPAP